MELTSKQQEVINLWKQASARFLGYFPSRNNTITVTITDKAASFPDDETGEVFRIMYDKDGNETGSAYYPFIIPTAGQWK